MAKIDTGQSQNHAAATGRAKNTVKGIVVGLFVRLPIGDCIPAKKIAEYSFVM